MKEIVIENELGVSVLYNEAPNIKKIQPDIWESILVAIDIEMTEYFDKKNSKEESG